MSRRQHLASRSRARSERPCSFRCSGGLWLRHGQGRSVPTCREWLLALLGETAWQTCATDSSASSGNKKGGPKGRLLGGKGAAVPPLSPGRRGFMVQRAGVAIMGLSAYHRVQRDSHTMQLILGHRLRGLSTLILAYARFE